MLGPRRMRRNTFGVAWRQASPALTQARRLTHPSTSPPPPPPRPDTRAPLPAQALKLRRALWMRMHPVERWTTLVVLGRRGAYLIEKPCTTPSERAPSAAPRSEVCLGSADAKVHFSPAATAAHAELCAVLPYPARLHLCLSLLLWVRCLRDVQDTLARVRLPYAGVRRPQRYAVADVFPTRLSEYWVDVHTTVSAKMHAGLNSTAEQVPAPHTWDVETAETIEDAATESTVTLDAGRVLHGQKAQRRLSGPALLRQVQGVQPRASADDEDGEAGDAARLGRGRRSTEGGRRRRRHRRLLHSASRQTALAGPSALSTDTAAATENALGRRRPTSREFLPDAERRVAPVSLETQPLEDAVYHGNTRRGEGCPMNDDGESTPNPVHIHVPPLSAQTSKSSHGGGGCKDGVLDVEVLLKHCVMAHAAIFSSLYIEGRVVDFSTNSTVVAAYVRWLLEELISDQYVSVTLVDAEAEASALYRPYYPAWCWRNVLVLLPPKARTHRCGAHNSHAARYSASLIKDWAARIVQAAPCSVIVEGGAVAAAAGGYVQQLKDEVQHLQQSRAYIQDELNTGTATAKKESTRRAVEWVPIVTSEVPTTTSSTGKENEASATSFQPQRRTATGVSILSAVNAAFRLPFLRRRADGKGGEDTSGAQHAHKQARFLAAVQETLHDRFYLCEFLYSPTQSCLTPYRFERWLLEQLPDNVRVVGVNTSPLDVLFYYPQGVFLTQKVGNAFRYRAVERTVVAKDLVPSWWSHPLRHTATQVKRLKRRWRTRSNSGGADIADGLHAELTLADKRELHRAMEGRAAQAGASETTTTQVQQTQRQAAEDKEVASHALVRERTVEYLAEPSKWTLLGLATARFFRV